MTAGKIALDYPGKYDIINCGIVGNRTVDLLARIKSDCINLKPDIMTAVIGVNDVWHEVDYKSGVSVEYAEILYACLSTRCAKPSRIPGYSFLSLLLLKAV